MISFTAGVKLLSTPPEIPLQMSKMKGFIYSVD